MKNKEVEIINKVMNKIVLKFPNLIKVARNEFLDFQDKETVNSKYLGQLFYGWFFSDFMLRDGKTMIALSNEILELTEEEKIFLENISKGVSGFFKIEKIENKKFYLLDLLTKKEYLVETLAIDKEIKMGMIIMANLVKNLDGDYFFFGGIEVSGEEEQVNFSLLEYTRELNSEEYFKHEWEIIQSLKDSKDFISLGGYLEEVFDLGDDEVYDFMKATEEKQKEMI
ncbi:MAG: hypothetical protein KJ718_05080 [Nanoarchaeota archaeon]|nr:hypothetical protein [Nanoarchaeota archaeon]MBU1051899.1 hypothetical protein [Nanoarchaeota archaeon]MBU1988942.1 hypothetical protein [Nanoarchaeota archaeon]